MKVTVEVMSDSVAQRPFQMALVLFSPVAALALVSLGVYGVLAYSMEWKRNEMGILVQAGAEDIQRDTDDVQRFVVVRNMFRR